MDSEQLPTHSEMGKMSEDFPVCWPYAISAVHLFSSEYVSPSTPLGPGQKPACLSQQQGLQIKYRPILFPHLTLVHPLVPTHFWNPMQQKDILKTTHTEFSTQNLTFSSKAPFLWSIKVHVGCVSWQRPQKRPGLLSVLQTTRGADTELELQTVLAVPLLDFIFWQQMERGFSCRSPKAGGSGEWDAVLSQLFLFA